MYFDEEIKTAYQRLSSSEKGLSENEAEERLKQYGCNELTQKKKKSRLIIFLEQFNSFVIYILIAAAIISALFGEIIDALVIAGILIANSILGYIQEFKAEEAIDALKKMSSLHSIVIRNNEEKKIDSKLLIPGDIIILEAGDKVPADARIIEANMFETQEAALTGESLPVKKETILVKSNSPVAEQINMVFSGTIVTNGRAKAIVTETGMKTELGKIANLIQETEEELTPLQKKVEKMGKYIGYMVLVICFVVFIVGALKNGNMLNMFLAAVALAVAAIPEGLPAVITIALAFGVQKMAKKNALMRHLPSVETLGSVTVICTDKTGTLTKNEMTVKKIFVDNKLVAVSGSGYDPKGEFSEKTTELIFKIGALCNNSQLSSEKIKEIESWKIIGDPTEACLLTVARKYGLHEEILNKKHPRIHEIEFDSDRKRMTTIHQIERKKFAYVKGAPDVILKLCSKININGKEIKLTEKEKKKILSVNDNMCKDALRVLGFAYKDVTKLNIKKIDEKIASKIEDDLVFVGLQGMMDPPREEVKIAIEKCKTAGIKVVMITGDYLKTAVAVAKELGIEGKAIEGNELDKLEFLEHHVDEITIYARVNPEHKLKIVDALKKRGHIVAMTGDGVNDAPALKKADIGIAMGITGTDVAKEASEMILTDDNFASIVGAIEEGRTIFDNIKIFLKYLLTGNAAGILAVFIALLIGLPMPLLALQILWFNLITETIPSIALTKEPPEKNNMKLKPKKPGETFVTKQDIAHMIITALIITLGVLGIFYFALIQTGWTPNQIIDLKTLPPNYIYATTMAFTVLVFFQLFNVLNAKSSGTIFFEELFNNKWLIVAIGISIILQIVVVSIPLMNQTFNTTPLNIFAWLACIGTASSILWIEEIYKFIISIKEKRKNLKIETA